MSDKEYMTPEGAKLYYEYAKARYDREASHADSLKTTASLLITSLALLITGVVAIFHGLELGLSVGHVLLYLIGTSIAILVGNMIWFMHGFFTGHQYGYPINGQKAKVQIHKGISHYEGYFRENSALDETKVTLINAYIAEMLGDAFSKYVDQNQESNIRKAKLLKDLWDRMMWLMVLVATAFVLNIYMNTFERSSIMPDDKISKDENTEIKPSIPPKPIPDLEGQLVTEGAELPKRKPNDTTTKK